MKRMGGALATILASAVVCSAAHAALPASSADIACNLLGGGSDHGPVSCTGDGDSGLITYSPDASLFATATGEGLVDSSGVFGTLNYSLEVTGGTPGDIVPIDIDTVLQAIPISIGYAFSEIIVTADDSDSVTICTELCGPGSGVTGFTGTLQVNAVSGAVYLNAVHLEVDVIGALGGTSDFDGGTASVDPHIYVDPGFANAGDYSILLSDGIGNEVVAAGGVPEPATWALTLLGVFGLGAALRGRHRALAAAF